MSIADAAEVVGAWPAPRISPDLSCLFLELGSPPTPLHHPFRMFLEPHPLTSACPFEAKPASIVGGHAV